MVDFKTDNLQDFFLINTTQIEDTSLHCTMVNYR